MGVPLPLPPGVPLGDVVGTIDHKELPNVAGGAVVEEEALAFDHGV